MAAVSRANHPRPPAGARASVAWSPRIDQGDDGTPSQELERRPDTEGPSAKDRNPRRAHRGFYESPVDARLREGPEKSINNREEGEDGRILNMYFFKPLNNLVPPFLPSSLLIGFLPTLRRLDILPHAPIRCSLLRSSSSFSRRSGCRRKKTPASVRTSSRRCKWRLIGPHRASRTRAAPGTAASRSRSTSAAVNGGVWKTTDAGRMWKPIFDDQPTGSIGAIAVAPSDAEHHLRRQRRRAAPARPLDRRRHLQVDRRRQDVDAPRPARRASRFRRSPSIRATRIGCSSRRSAIPTAPTRSAASTVRPMAGRRSRRCSRRTRTPAATTSTSIPRIPTSSTRRCGKSGRGRGRTRSGPAPAAASSSRPTAARRGSS